MTGKKGFHIFTAFGLPVRIDPSWFLIVALVAWTLATGYFPMHFKGGDTAFYWFLGISAAILLFVSVLLHEFGHALVAKRNNMPAKGITLFLFGGVSELPREPSSPGIEARVTLGGWLVSLFLAVIFFVLFRLIKTTPTLTSYAALALCQYLAVVNGLLFIFNGVPGLPLDGGRLFRALVWKITGNLRKATRIASSVGSAFGLLLIVLGIFSLFYNNLVSGIWLAVIGLFLRGGAQSSYQQLVIRRALQGVHVKDLMSRSVVTVPANLTLQQIMDDFFMKEHYHSFPVMDGDRVIGLVSLHDVKEYPESDWPERIARDVTDKQEELPLLAPDHDAMDAFATMLQNDWGRLPVVEDGCLVGIVSRRDVLHMLAIKTDLVPDRGN